MPARALERASTRDLDIEPPPWLTRREFHAFQSRITALQREQAFVRINGKHFVIDALNVSQEPRYVLTQED